MKLEIAKYWKKGFFVSLLINLITDISNLLLGVKSQLIELDGNFNVFIVLPILILLFIIQPYIIGYGISYMEAKRWI